MLKVQIRFRTMVAILILPLGVLGQDAPAPRAVEPDENAQKQAEKVIRDLFKEEYSKRAPADQQALAKKLIQQGIDTLNDLPARFVLFREAREIAMKGGDAETALIAITETAKYFEFDGLALKSKTLLAMMSGTKSPEAAGTVVEALLGVVDEAVRLENFEVAKNLVSKAESAAKAAKDASRVAKIQKKGKEVAEIQRESEKANEAAKTLESNPADPDAALNLGRYLLMKGELEKARPLLSKGADPLLRVAADRELAAPTKPEDQAAAGDAWWEASEKEKNLRLKAILLGYAKDNYEEALDSLSGIAKTKVEKRLKELTRNLTGWINLMPMINVDNDSHKGNWLKKDCLESPDVEGACLVINYSPPPQYSLRMLVNRVSGADSFVIGLSRGNTQFEVKFDCWGGTVGGIAFVNGKDVNDNETSVRKRTFPDDKAKLIECLVSNDRVVVMVDGNTFIHWKANYAILDRPRHYYGGNRSNILYLGSNWSRFQIKKLEVSALGR